MIDIDSPLSERIAKAWKGKREASRTKNPDMYWERSALFAEAREHGWTLGDMARAAGFLPGGGATARIRKRLEVWDNDDID